MKAKRDSVFINNTIQAFRKCQLQANLKKKTTYIQCSRGNPQSIYVCINRQVKVVQNMNIKVIYKRPQEEVFIPQCNPRICSSVHTLLKTRKIVTPTLSSRLCGSG